ncbi:hypothetical protein FANTH_7923 [Fusarium anthophilum]|uniref:Uncharacterized protein n=1 Tax=Fusarium anthophilum TaxID=48485 RepID=A0A8H4ZD56_9HYPO|nr:hypothetical protein FANTH_7923 [Fusarium anthophilum]
MVPMPNLTQKLYANISPARSWIVLLLAHPSAPASHDQKGGSSNVGFGSRHPARPARLAKPIITWACKKTGDFYASLDRIDREFWVNTFLEPSWLFNLTYNHDEECDPRLKRNPLFNEEMKHVLWCHNPGCATGSERRWERMALLYINDAFNKGELEDGSDTDKKQARDMAWLSLEHDVFNDLTTRATSES